MSLRLTTVHENARSAVECGSLLPLSPAGRDQLASRAAVYPRLWSEAASKLAGSKRQQAAALHSARGAQVPCIQWGLRIFSDQRRICFSLLRATKWAMSAVHRSR